MNLGDIVCYFETIFLDTQAENAEEKKGKGRKNNVVKLETVKRLLPICSNCNRWRHWK